MRNVFFDNFNNFSEQNLIEDLIIESIGIYGHDVMFCPRKVVNKDDIYGEDTISEYDSAYLTTVYIKSYDSYEGDGTFLSKFNLEIRDQITFVVANKTFQDEVGNPAGLIRPREGDLIFSEMMNRTFVIKYVDNKPTFYQMGSLQSMALTCEVWEYSSEKLNTGIDAIDSMEDRYSTDEQNAVTLHLDDDGNQILDNNGFPIILGQFDFDTQNEDVFADNDEFELEGAGIVDWSEHDPFGEEDTI